METLEHILAEHSFFKDLDSGYMSLITGCAANVRFKAGELIFREGDEAGQFYIIREGKVALEIFVPGRGSVTIQTVGENEVFGWSWLFPPYRWQFDARTIEPVRVITLDGRCLRSKCEADPALGYDLMKRLSRVIVDRLQATRLQLLDIYGVQS